MTYKFSNKNLYSKVALRLTPFKYGLTFGCDSIRSKLNQFGISYFNRQSSINYNSEKSFINLFGIVDTIQFIDLRCNFTRTKTVYSSNKCKLNRSSAEFQIKLYAKARCCMYRNIIVENVQRHTLIHLFGFFGLAFKTCL